MIKTKKAFTILELVFVIVIIGILLSVVLPRLVATRDDAKIAVALTDTGRLLSELTIYYTSNAYFESNLSKMTTVKDAKYTTAWDDTTERGVITFYTPKNRTGLESCFTISIQNSDGNISVNNIVGTHENVCRGLQSIAVYKKLLKTTSLIGNNIF